MLSAFFTAAVYGQRRLVPSIHSSHAIHQFGSIGIEGKLKWAFQSCREFPDSTDIGDPKALTALDRKNADKADIAIADLTEPWSMLSMRRGAYAIDLDSWKEILTKKIIFNSASSKYLQLIALGVKSQFHLASSCKNTQPSGIDSHSHRMCIRGQ